MFVNFNILNQLGSPAINSNTFANRPAAGQTGRLFVSTDTYEIYRDNGTTWDLIGGPGSSTITGSGTATQVAYFTSSQAIGSSANLFWDNTNTRLGIGTATPGAALDVHSTGTIAQFNTTSATGNTYISFQRTGTGLWRVGDTYNAGNNFFELHNTVLGVDAMEFQAATNKSAFQAQQTYTTGLARGNYFDFNLSVAAGGSFSSPNAITALGASLDLTLAGNATIPSGARSGLDAYNSIAFTGAGTLTHTQGTQIRAYSNVTAGWAFNGSATGTITHLAGLRALFPDNSGSAVNVTNNYALLLNDQTANTGTVTYTNRWGIYQEGSSDINYMAANLLLGTTTNTSEKLRVVGTSYFSSNVGIGDAPTFMLDVKTSAITVARFLSNASGKRNNILLQNNANYNYGVIGVVSATGTITGDVYGLGYSASGSVAFTEVLNWTSAGLVGIGTSTPTDRLTVVSSGTKSTIAIGNTASSTYSQLLMYGGATKYNWSIGAQYNVNNAFEITPSTATEGTTFTTPAFLITSGGLVGIGNSSPSYRLSITATGAETYPIVATNGTVEGALYIGTPTSGITGAYFGTRTNHDCVYGANAANAYFVVKTSGSLGLNTISPNIGGVNRAITINSATNTNCSYELAVNGTQLGAFFTTASTNAANLYSTQNGALTFGTNNTERARITSGGNFLIGTTTDSGNKLEVTGTARIGNGTSGTNFSIRQENNYLVQFRSQTGTIAGNKVDLYIDSSGGQYSFSNSTTANIFQIDGSGNTTSAGYVKTAAPTTGTSGNWKLGSRVAATVVVNTTEYIEVDIGGTLYKLATVT